MTEQLTSGVELIDLTDDEESQIKPSQVLFEEHDVAGGRVYGFRTYKRKSALAEKASTNMKLPPKTPHSHRMKIKKRLNALAANDSSSGSEYKNETDSESNSEADKEKNDNNKPLIKRSNLTNKKITLDAYEMKPDNYFTWQAAASKCITSNHTLKKLESKKLTSDQLKELLTISTQHDSHISELIQTNCSYNFNKWLCVMNEGFNVLLYGLGSKRNILKMFQKDFLSKSPVIVVNGYFPSLMVKDILDAIVVDLLNESSLNLHESLEFIQEQFKCNRKLEDIHFYVIVHNIDGPMLRNAKSQSVLATLAAIPNIHLLASIDHINTPLIWDHSKLSQFNFTWWDVTSFLPYKDETSFENSLLVQRSGALALTSLTNVYKSLTKNSKSIFMLIVTYQLANNTSRQYQGMPLKVLYSQCREQFLVSSDLTLRSQLTEFIDHDLVKMKRSSDGTEQLQIPINNSLLQQFVDEQN